MTETRGLKRLALGSLLADWELWAKRIYDARTTGASLGPCTGLKHIDEEICGAFQTGLHVITGDTGAGKTAFALQVACACGVPAFYVSCEMAPMELLRRIIARTTGTFLGRLKSGELSPAAMKRLAMTAAKSAPLLSIGDARDDYATPQWIYEHAADIREESGCAQVLVVVDSLHSWIDSEGLNMPEYERINKGVSTLRSITSQLDSPVIYIAERNRASKTQGGTGSGAGSRKIEYGAETQIDLNRDMNSEPDTNHNVSVEARFVKNRNGSPNRTVNLKFNGALQTFTEGFNG